MVAAAKARRRSSVPELAAGPGDEDAHGSVRPALSGSHHHRLSRYQATVASSASSSVRAGFQPSALHLGGVDRVAAVVAEPVGDVLDQRRRRAAEGEEPLGELAVGDLVAGTDVVDLADRRPAAARGRRRRSCPRRSTSRGRSARRRRAAPCRPSSRLVTNSGMTFSGNWYGPKLFDERVTTTGQAVGLVVRERDEVGAGLGRRVRRAGLERVGLGERALLDRAVDLVGGDVQEALDADAGGPRRTSRWCRRSWCARTRRGRRSSGRRGSRRRSARPRRGRPWRR